jgi:hypothetical protein
VLINKQHIEKINAKKYVSVNNQIRYSLKVKEKNSHINFYFLTIVQPIQTAQLLMEVVKYKHYEDKNIWSVQRKEFNSEIDLDLQVIPTNKIDGFVNV